LPKIVYQVNKRRKKRGSRRGAEAQRRGRKIRVLKGSTEVKQKEKKKRKNNRIS
jgi:hypothetical protein